MKVIGKILAVILSIVYFIGLSILMFGTFATNLLSRNYYVDILKNTDLKTIKVSDLGNTFENTDIDPNSSLENVIIDYITASDIDEKTALAIIENEEIRTILGNYIGDYINYTVGGEEPKIVRTDVETVLKNPNVTKALEHEPTEEEIDKIYNQLTGLVKEMLEDRGKEYGSSNRNKENNIAN